MVFLGLAKHRLHTDLLQRLRSLYLGYRFGPIKKARFLYTMGHFKRRCPLLRHKKRTSERERKIEFITISASKGEG